jgi:hypothetical protein
MMNDGHNGNDDDNDDFVNPPADEQSRNDRNPAIFEDWPCVAISQHQKNPKWQNC